MKIGQPFLTIIICMYVHVYIRNTKESVSLNLDIGKTNWLSNVIAYIRDSAISLGVSHMADPTHFWSVIFMFCSKNGRWQAANSSLHVSTHSCMNIRMYTHAHMHTYTHSHKHACTHARTHAHMHAHTHARTHTRTHAHMHMYLRQGATILWSHLLVVGKVHSI